MFADLYIIHIRKIFKMIKLFKLNALTLLIIADKKHERHIIIKSFKNRKFCCLKVMIIKDYDDRK